MSEAKVSVKQAQRREQQERSALSDEIFSEQTYSRHLYTTAATAADFGGLGSALGLGSRNRQRKTKRKRFAESP